jgi:hypothetical protein
MAPWFRAVRRRTPPVGVSLPIVEESSLLKLATNVVGATASIVSIAGAAVGFATTQNLVIALGIAGIIYSAVLTGFYFRASLRQREPWRSALFGGIAFLCFLIILEAIFGKFVPIWTKTYAHFASFGVLQVLGITGLTFIGAAWVWGAFKESKEIKVCPDCAEKCKKKAHVCRWCGFRWTACHEKTLVPSDEKVT